ncbi:hypothetical protein [Blastomonas sp. CCH2-A2]|jgi:hypothetical protein|uniref:hypothetical protein n=1 Tax=Blastomonas sp. CCH2-A2 TaxID=1768788 RepID=UPI000824BD2D|nr:hypothetical protein [Blastomonas sp. CCH2-A2]
MGTRVSPSSEARRVAAILARDEADRIAEQSRADAERNVRLGLPANEADLIIPPTPEWIAKGDAIPYRPRHDGQWASLSEGITTMRRVLTPIATRLHRAGKLNDEQLSACTWYRRTYDEAGLEGAMPGTDFLKEVWTAPQSRGMNFTEEQVAAQEQLRQARAAMPSAFVKFFEAVILYDIPVKRAARAHKCRFRHEVQCLRDCATSVSNYLETLEEMQRKLNEALGE